MDPNIVNIKLQRMQLREAVDQGKYLEVPVHCRACGATEMELVEIEGATLIRSLKYSKIGYDKLGSLLKNFFELPTDLLQGEVAIGSRLGLSLGSRKQVLIDLLGVIRVPVVHHAEDGRSAKEAINLFLSDEMTAALRIFAEDRSMSQAIGEFMGRSYYFLLVSPTMEISPMDVLDNYLSRLEKWKGDLTKFVRGSLIIDLGGYRSYNCGRFGSIISSLEITEIAKYERLRKVVDLAIEIVSSTFDDAIEVSRQVADWLSIIPTDSAKEHIRQDLLTRHALDVVVLDRNIIPTDRFLRKRLDSALAGWLEWMSSDVSPESILACVVNDEHKIVVSHAILRKLRQGANDMECYRIAALAQLGDRVYNRELISNEFGGMVVQALLDENLEQLRTLVSLIPFLYIGKRPEVLQLVAE